LQAKGIRLLLVVAHAEVLDIQRVERLEDRVYYLGRRVSVPDAINDFPRGTEIGTAA
jgi:SulP family sulfate permease